MKILTPIFVFLSLIAKSQCPSDINNALAFPYSFGSSCTSLVSSTAGEKAKAYFERAICIKQGLPYASSGCAANTDSVMAYSFPYVPGTGCAFLQQCTWGERAEVFFLRQILASSGGGGGGSLTSTYIGYGSSGNVLTGSQNLTLSTNTKLLLFGNPSLGGRTIQAVADPTNALFSFFEVGDIDVLNNATRFIVRDSLSRYEFTKPNFLIDAVPYTFPSSNASGVLTNNGSGTLTWSALPTYISDSGCAGSSSITITAAKPRGFSIKSTWPGQSAITTVGTLTSGATGSGFTVALGSSTITGQLPIANGGTNGNHISTDSIKVTGGSMIITGNSQMIQNDTASGSATALTVSYTGIVDGETVYIKYYKTTASNLVLTFPTSAAGHTEVSQNSHGTWASGPVETLISTSSGCYEIILHKFFKTYDVSIIQITP